MGFKQVKANIVDFNYTCYVVKKMDFHTIETERLLLRKLSDTDYVNLLLQGSDTDIMYYLGIEKQNIAQEKEKAQKGYATFNKSLLIFQLVRKTDDKLIGWCGFHTWYVKHKRAEIGYALTDEMSKKSGLMSEAMHEVLNYAWTEMELHRVEAFVALDNEASIRLLQKFGFVQEGHLREHYWKNGRFEDSLLFGLLKK